MQEQREAGKDIKRVIDDFGVVPANVSQMDISDINAAFNIGS
jgi:hypothetical protein